MKEELIRVLNAKLDNINSNIDSLVELNNKIDNEKDKLAYIKKILEIFQNGEDYDIFKFVDLKKEDFNRVLGIVSNGSEKVFNTDSCNYDGLVYLIKGINSGVSLTLTEEQKSSIEYLIRGLCEKEEEYNSVIDGLLLVKTHFETDDLDVLYAYKKDYSNIVDKINTNDYIDETMKVVEAMEFNHLTSDDRVKLLTYILEYNADAYKKKKNNINEAHIATSFDKLESELPHDVEAPLPYEETPFTFKPFEMQGIRENTQGVMPDEKNSEKTTSDIEMYSPFESPNNLTEEKDVTFEEPSNFEPLENENVKETMANVIQPNVTSLDTVVDSTKKFEIPEETIKDELHSVPQEEVVNDSIDQDFAGVIAGNDYENEPEEEEKTSARELQRLFGEYGLANIAISEQLREGNANKYRQVIETLKRNDLLDRFASNKELLQDAMLNSGEEEIETILKIIKEELSVDEDDYKETVKIVFDTLPTVFIKDGGNYDNFVKNVRLFKNIGIDLINLFDYSKEVFIVDNDFMLNNYNIVKKYNVGIDYKNAKYLLVLPNIAERLDYYVESVYEDKTRGNEKFDGINYINNYAVKLNTVCDLIIKRLRYSSETGNKVFGSKPNSLTGEITNLKVNALEISDEYLNNFFNNEFEGLTTEEVREFTKLIRNSSNVGNYSDELSNIEKYHIGLRYIIEGINISYNKTIRIYNILRSYGIDNNKALHFALCYNLVIMKEEYHVLKRVIEELGGNA